jgi:hypothetical protein
MLADILNRERLQLLLVHPSSPLLRQSE